MSAKGNFLSLILRLRDERLIQAGGCMLMHPNVLPKRDTTMSVFDFIPSVMYEKKARRKVKKREGSRVFCPDVALVRRVRL